MSKEISADSASPESESPVLMATAEQLFTGSDIGLPTLEAVCQSCTRTLHEGASCTVYAYQPAEDVQWYTRGCDCEECAPVTVQTPTLGTNEVLIHAVLGTIVLQSRQTYRLCLTGVTLVAYSPSTEGSKP